MSLNKRDLAGVIGLLLSFSIITNIQEPNFGLVTLDNTEALGYNFATLFFPIMGVSLVTFSLKRSIKSELLIKFLLGAGLLIAFNLSFLLSLNKNERIDENLTFDNLYEETGMYVIDKLVGADVSYSLQYNTSEWSIPIETYNNDAEYELNSVNNSYAIIIAEKPNLGIEKVLRSVKSHQQEESESFEILEESMIDKNGKTFADLITKAKVDGTDFTYYGRVYAGKEGTIQVMTYTFSNLFDENRDSLKQLLDGLDIKDSTTNEVQNSINYSVPTI